MTHGSYLHFCNFLKLLMKTQKTLDAYRAALRHCRLKDKYSFSMNQLNFIDVVNASKSQSTCFEVRSKREFILKSSFIKSTLTRCYPWNPPEASMYLKWNRRMNWNNVILNKKHPRQSSFWACLNSSLKQTFWGS